MSGTRSIGCSSPAPLATGAAAEATTAGAEPASGAEPPLGLVSVWVACGGGEVVAGRASPSGGRAAPPREHAPRAARRSAAIIALDRFISRIGPKGAHGVKSSCETRRDAHESRR